ncbi:MAG: hypothetical protein ABR581_06835 [Thermoleophilaceae bacterium]
MEAPDREAVDSGSGGGAGTAVLEPPGETQDEHREHEEKHSKLPHLWADRPLPVRIFLITIPPALFGSLCGWVLGESKVAYLILTLPVAILLQIVVGLEHRNAREAMFRGFVAGGFFGGFILIVNQILIDTEPKFELKDPKWQLAIITAVFGAILCRIGRGQRIELEKDKPYFDRSRVSRGELVGMAAGLLLLGAMFLPWFATSGSNPHSRINTAHIGPGEMANAWETFKLLDALLVLALIAPFILTWILIRGHALTWRPGELTAIAGITAFILILCNGIILGKPKPGIEISLSIGYFVGLLAAAGLVYAGYLRQSHYTDNKPPGVL